jgi:glycolate oxidase
MQRELGAPVCAMQNAVKSVLDPMNLFNPGKVVG